MNAAKVEYNLLDQVRIVGQRQNIIVWVSPRLSVTLTAGIFFFKYNDLYSNFLIFQKNYLQKLTLHCFQMKPRFIFCQPQTQNLYQAKVLK